MRDNPALHAAAAGATRGAVALYVVSPKDWERHDDAPVKVEFILRNLAELSEQLGKRNIALLVERAEHFSDVPRIVLEAAERHECDALHFNRNYEVNERERDDEATRLFREAGREVRAFDGIVVLPPGGVLTNDGGFYSVYSPFKRKWRERFDELGRPEPLPICAKQSEMVGKPGAIPKKVEGFESSIDPEEWPAGESHAKRRMESFLESRIEEYKDRRDLPGVNGTSTMSPYLTSGVVSPKQLIHAAMEVNQHKHDAGKKGVVKWIEEVLWREFYTHMLIGFPRVSKHRPLQTDTEKIRWKRSDEHLRAWKEGRTGYPIVDAGMRQLTARGWMHNRVRMITASFLSKD
ncbi:MAG: cryptochrome/photolyase family protein, partial [Phycisphaerales bacterium]